MSAFDHVWKRAGGHAFPVSYETGGPDGDSVTHHGMSMRDYFAAKAMQANIAIFEDWPAGERANDIAKYSYAMADAMLAEREKP